MRRPSPSLHPSGPAWIIIIGNMKAHTAFRYVNLVFCVSLAVHTLALFTAQPFFQPDFFSDDLSVQANSASTLQGDAEKYYGKYARWILERGSYAGPEGPVTSHMPGIPLLLAFSKSLVGHLGPYAFLQMLLFFAGAYYYCRRAAVHYGEKTAALAAVFFLAHPVMLPTSWTVNSDAVFTALLLTVFALLMREGVSPVIGAAAAFPAGLAFYFREVGLVCGLMIAVALLRRPDRDRFVPAIYTLTFLCLIAPWAVRNAAVTDSMLITTTKSPKLFFQSSLGFTLQDLNPFDIDKGGLINYSSLERRTKEYVESSGRNPEEPPDRAFYLSHGTRNYLSQPAAQLKSLSLKAANLFRPAVARRHLGKFLTPAVSTAAYSLLFLFHAVFFWFGLVLVVKRDDPGLSEVRWVLLGTVLVSLALWSEPRYLLPFYLPACVLSVSACARLLSGRSRW